MKDKKFTPAEEPQDIVEPAVTRSNYLWWGSTYHMQTPLENLSTGAVILIELKDVDDGNNRALQFHSLSTGHCNCIRLDTLFQRH